MEQKVMETLDTIASGIDEMKEKIKALERKSDENEVERKKMLSAFGTEPENRTKKGSFHYERKSDYDKIFFDTYLKKGQAFLTAEELKVLRLASDPAAGYLTSTEFSREIIKGITEFSPIRAEATVRSTSSKDIEFPKRTALPDTYWVGEIQERIEDVSLEYGMEKLTPHEMISFKKVSLQQLEDAEFNLEDELGGAFSEGFGKKEGTGFISGSGVLQPEGILVNADIGETETAGSGVIAAADLITFPYNIPRGYRAGAKWYMNDTTIAAVRLLKDDANRFLFVDPIAGEPARLLGYEVVSCPDMPAIATGAYSVFFGNLKKGYLVIDRIQTSIQVLRERYAEYGIVGYLARKRVDGQVVLAEAIHKLKIQ